MTNITNLTEKELSVLRVLTGLESVVNDGSLKADYEVFKFAGVTLKPKSYVGVINSLKKKGQVTVEGVGIKGFVRTI